MAELGISIRGTRISHPMEGYLHEGGLPMQLGHVEGERGMDGWMNPYEPRGTAYGTNKRRGRRGRRTRQYPVATPGLFVPRSHRITFLQ